MDPVSIAAPHPRGGPLSKLLRSDGDIPELVGKSVDKVEKKIESGNTTTEAILAKVEERFGEEVAQSILNDDGSINFDELESFITERRVNNVTVRLERRFGDEGLSLIDENGVVDVEGLKDLILAQRKDGPPFIGPPDVEPPFIGPPDVAQIVSDTLDVGSGESSEPLISVVV